MKKFLSATRISGIITMVFSAIAFVTATTFDSSAMLTNDPLGAAAWPLFLTGAMFLMGTILVIFGDKTTKVSQGNDDKSESSSKKQPVQLLVTIFAMIVYLLLFEVLGFLIVTPIFILIMTLYYGGKLKVAIIYAIVLTSVLYFLFKVAMGILLPPIPFI